MSLDEKREIYKIPMGGKDEPFYWEKHVKQFIKELKEEIRKRKKMKFSSFEDIRYFIDNKAGKGLL